MAEIIEQTLPSVSDFISGSDVIGILDLLQVSNGNLHNYMETKNWNSKKQRQFLDTYQYVIDGIKSGNIYRKENGDLIDRTGGLNNTLKGFDSGGEVALYFSKVMEAIPYSSSNPTASGKELFTNHAHDLEQAFYKGAFGGTDNLNELGMLIWIDLDAKKSDGTRDVTHRVNAFLPYLTNYIASLDNTDYDYTGSNFQDVNAYKQALQTLQLALQSKGYDNNALNAWMKAGLPIELGNALFNTGEIIQTAQSAQESKVLQTPENTRTAAIKKLMEDNPGLSEEAATIQYDNSLKEALAQNDAIINEHKWLNFYDSTYANKSYIKRSINLSEFDKNFNFDRTNSWFGTKLSSKARNTWYNWYNNLLKTPDKLLSVRNSGTNFSGSILRLLLEQDALQADKGQSKTMTRIGSTNRYLLGVNYSDGTAYVYDKDTSLLNKIHVDLNTTPTLLALLKNHYLSANKKTTYNKKGGVLKALNGTLLNLQYEDWNSSMNLLVAANAQLSHKDKERYVAGQKKVVKNGKLLLDSIATARLAGAIMDVGSAIAAFAPVYGTAASGALSLGAIGTELGADLADKSVSWWDLTKNTLANIGFGVAGLIPVVGTEGKFAKAGKTFIKYLPSIFAAYSTVAGADDAYKIFEKLRDGKDVNVEEWKELAYWVAGATGVLRTAGTTLKARAISKAATETSHLDKITIKTDKGPKEITGELKERLTKASTPEEANTILKEAHPDANIEYKRSTLQPWKKNKLLVEETHNSEYKIDFAKLRGLGTSGKTKLGLISDIDMLTGKGNITGIHALNGAGNRITGWLPSFDNLNPYTKTSGKSTVITPTNTSTVTPTTSTTTANTIEPSSTVKPKYVKTDNTSKGSKSKPLLGVSKHITRAKAENLVVPDNYEVINLRNESGALNNAGQLSREQMAKLDAMDPLWRLKRYTQSSVLEINPLTTQLAKMAVIDKANNKVYIWKNGHKIPRASLGSVLTLQFLALPEYTYDDKDSTWDYDTLYGMQNTGLYANPWENDGLSQQDSSSYRIKKVSKPLGQSVENLKQYQDFTKALQESLTEYQEDPSKIATNLFYNWAKKVDESIPNSPSTFFDENGNLRKSWTTQSTRYYGGKPLTFDDVNKYLEYVRNDLALGSRHNDFQRVGKRYYYVDKNGTLHWISPEDAKKYTLRNRSTFTLDGITRWEDLEVIIPGLSKTSTSEDTSKESETKPTGDIFLPQNKGNLGGYLYKLAANPDLLAAGRLVMNLRNNKKVADETIAGIKSSLLSPINKHYYIEGDLDSKMLRYNDAAKTEQMGRRLASGSTNRADAIAAMLSTNESANKLREEGDAIYNQRVQQTRAKNWEVANEVYDYNKKVLDSNNASINAALKAIHDIRAAKMSSDLTNWNTFLEGKELQIRQNQNRLQEFNLAAALHAYEAKLNHIMDNTLEKTNLLLALTAFQNTKPTDANYGLLKTAYENAYNAYLDKYNLSEETLYNDYLRLLADILGLSYNANGVKQQVKLAINNYKKNKGVLTRDTYEKYLNGITALSDEDRQELLEAEFPSKKEQGGKLLQLKSLKSGGDILKAKIKAMSDDNKEFYKNVRHSQDLHRKALDNLSKATLLAIKKAMNL